MIRTLIKYVLSAYFLQVLHTQSTLHVLTHFIPWIVYINGFQTSFDHSSQQETHLTYY